MEWGNIISTLQVVLAGMYMYCQKTIEGPTPYTCTNTVIYAKTQTVAYPLSEILKRQQQT